MELAPFVPLRESLCVPCLASAILAEILCGFGDDVREELHFHTAKRLTYGRQNQDTVQDRQGLKSQTLISHQRLWPLIMDFIEVDEQLALVSYMSEFPAQ